MLETCQPLLPARSLVPAQVTSLLQTAEHTTVHLPRDACPLGTTRYTDLGGAQKVQLWVWQSVAKGRSNTYHLTKRSGYISVFTTGKVQSHLSLIHI